VAGMLVPARMMAMKKQGEELSMPKAQMRGSAFGNLSLSLLDM